MCWHYVAPAVWVLKIVSMRLGKYFKGETFIFMHLPKYYKNPVTAEIYAGLGPKYKFSWTLFKRQKSPKSCDSEYLNFKHLVSVLTPDHQGWLFSFCGGDCLLGIRKILNLVISVFSPLCPSPFYFPKFPSYQVFTNINHFQFFA